MIDAEELYHRLLSTCKEEGLVLSDEADEALADAARKVVEDHEEESDDRGPNDRYQMYTRAGNDAVAEGVAVLVGAIRNGSLTRLQLPDAIETMREEVAKDHGEVYDTEPRCSILDALDKECDAQGWKRLDY